MKKKDRCLSIFRDICHWCFDVNKVSLNFFKFFFLCTVRSLFDTYDHLCFLVAIPNLKSMIPDNSRIRIIANSTGLL